MKKALPTYPEDTRSWANGINNNGQIVGVLYDTYTEHAVLWQPVPEASSFLALFCGIISLSGIAWRKRGN